MDAAPDRDLSREVANHGSYSLLLAALSASAGWGVFLMYGVAKEGRPPIAGLRGLLQAALILYFILAVPFALGTLALRLKLVRMPRARLRMLSALGVLATGIAFVGWLLANLTIKHDTALLND
jgi:hypothetical protein